MREGGGAEEVGLCCLSVSMLWNLDDSLPQLTPISYSQRQELLGPGGCLGLALAPLFKLGRTVSQYDTLSQVPHCQARLAGVLTSHHQSLPGTRGRFCGPERGRGELEGRSVKDGLPFQG